MAKSKNRVRMGNGDVAAAYTAKRKAKALDKHEDGGPGRKRPVVENSAVFSFMKRQAADRWPTEASKIKRVQLDIDDARKKKGRENNRADRERKEVKPLGFPFMEAIGEQSYAAAAKLLTAASLKIKRVKRHPGWILQKTYNLKGRVLEIV